MKKKFHKRTPSSLPLASLLGILLAMLGLVLSAAVQPAQAEPPAQAVTPTATFTLTPTVTTTGTLVGTPTVTLTPTATRAGTLPAPARTGTPTALIPVTGADLTGQGGNARLGTWIALWLLGLLMVIFGLRSRLTDR